MELCQIMAYVWDYVMGIHAAVWLHPIKEQICMLPVTSQGISVTAWSTTVGMKCKS